MKSVDIRISGMFEEVEALDENRDKRVFVEVGAAANDTNE